MTIIVLEVCPPRLRGDLTKWLMEVNTGVYVGNLNPRIREALWDRICEHVKNGRVTMVYRAQNEQRMQFRVHNTTWEPADFDGLTLMRRPLPQHRPSEGASFALPDGFSNAAHQQKARRMAHRRPGVEEYAVIDVETTGLLPMQDEIIEIAAVCVRAGAAEAEFSRLIRIDRPLTQEVIRLTGISDQLLRESGVLLHEALEDLQAFVADRPLVSHNAVFDQQFLTAAFSKMQLPMLRNRFIDTLPLARRKLRGVPSYKLSVLAGHLGIISDHPHRALADCHVTRALFDKLNEK